MVELSRVQDQYIVIEDDGTTHGPYDERFKAAAKSREIKKEEANKPGKAQRAASRFASGVNKAARKAGDAGRNLAETADQKAQQAADREQGEMADEDINQSQGPTLDSLFGGTGGGGSEDNAPQLAFMGGGGEDRDDPQLPFMDSGGGDGPQMPDSGGGGDGDSQPYIPGFGMEESDDDENDPFNFF